MVALDLQQAGQLRRDGVALPRQLDRRGHHVGQLHRAVFFQRMGQPGDGAGDADRQMGVERAVGDHLALLVEIHVAESLGRGHLAEVAGDVLAALGVMDDHEAAAADIAGVRQHHRQGEADGHRRIDRIAAAPEDVDADLGRQPVFGGHHPVLAADGIEDVVADVVADGCGR